MRKTTTINLDCQQQQDILSEMAASFGLCITRGVGSGEIGSVSLLMKAIANGELLITANPDGPIVVYPQKPGIDIKRRAHALVLQAVKAGKLPQINTISCSECDAPSDYYHHEDYDKPLDVIPLCRRHHFTLHRKTS